MPEELTIDELIPEHAVEQAEKLSTDRVIQRLRERFAPPAYGFLTEVGDATGGRHTRWCDALAMSLWPSRGLEIIGIEVKVSRSDWTKELKDPSKADAICKFCDRWYLAVGDKSIVKPGELPATWGLLIPHRGGMRIEVEAPKLKAEPITRHLMAAVFRRAAEQSVDEKALKKARDEGFQAGNADLNGRLIAVTKAHDRSMEEVCKKIREYQEASGLEIASGWRGGAEVGRVVNDVLRGRYRTPVSKLQQIKDAAERLAADMGALMEAGNECLVGETSANE